MPTPAHSNFDARAVRQLLQAALLGSALAGCASLDSGTAPTAAAPVAAAPAQAPAKAPAQTVAQPAQTNVPPPTAAEKPAAVVVEQGARIEGSLSSRIVERWSGGGDHDLDQINLLSMDWSDPREPWIKAHVVARVSADLDGRQSGSVYNGLSDIHDQSVDFKLYDAYVDIMPAEGLGWLRIGRQMEFDTPEIVHYDGLSFRTSPAGQSEFTAGAYGGIPVRLYQGASDSRAIFGAFAEERPWTGGRLRFDWMHLEDETVPNDNGILSLGLWQRFDRNWSGEAQYSRLEDQDRDLRLRTQWASTSGSFSATATYYQLFETQNQLPADIDPYTAILMALFPYQQYGLSISSELSRKITLDLAADARTVNDSGDQSEFNRNWERYRATAIFHDVLTPKLDLGITADFWNGDGRDISTWGADLSYDTQQEWRFGLGSYYALYKYDIFQNTEEDDVRTYYARTSWKVGPKVTLDLSYEYEDDLDQYNVLRGGVVWRF